MGGARRGVGIAQPVQLRIDPNLLSGAISPGRTSITPWAWPVGCADRSGFGRYQPGNPFNPRSASKPTYMPPRDYAGATPAGGEIEKTGGIRVEALPDRGRAGRVGGAGCNGGGVNAPVECRVLLGDCRGVLGAATVRRMAMLDREKKKKKKKNKLDYWREIEESCNRMIALYEEQLKQMEAERDGAGR